MIGVNNNLQQIFPNVDSILLLLVFLFVELIATYSKSCAVSEKTPKPGQERWDAQQEVGNLSKRFIEVHIVSPADAVEKKKLCNISILKMHDSPFHRAREITGSRTTKGRTILFAKATWVLIDHGKHKDTHPTSQNSMDVQSLLNKNRGKNQHPSTTNNFEAEEMQ